MFSFLLTWPEIVPIIEVMATSTITKEELEQVREVFESWTQTWAFHIVIRELDPEFHFSQDAFDLFTSEARDGIRCISCGRADWVQMETGEDEMICESCGGVAQ